MEPLPSGRYTIANAKFKNVATLLTGDQASDIVSGAHIDIPNAQWDIERLKNNNYMIKNHQYDSFVGHGPNPEPGESVLVQKSLRQWKIKKMHKDNQYVIYPSSAFVYWGLGDGEIATPIQFASTENDPKNQWAFNKVSVEVSSEIINQIGDLAIDQDFWEINSSDIEFGQKIGEGGFGKVFEGTWKKSPVALKVLINKGGISATSSAIHREIKVWSRLRHPHVLQFLGACLSGKRPYIVMPLMDNGNGREYIDRNPDCNRQRMIHQTSLGLLYLHTLNIVHGDLKLLNILIDQGGKAVLCDFGLSRIKADITSRTIMETPTITTGSRNWMSPERLKGRSPTKPSDIYAFGMVIYEIHTNEIPLDIEVEYSEFKKLVADEDTRPERPEYDETPQMTDDIWQLAEDCWRKDPLSRPIVDTVCDKISIFVNKSPFQHQAKSQAQAQTTEPLPLPNPSQQEPAPAAKPPPSEHTPLVLPVMSDPVIHTPALVVESSPYPLPVSSQPEPAPTASLPLLEHTLPSLPVMSDPALHSPALVVEPPPHPRLVSTQPVPALSANPLPLLSSPIVLRPAPRTFHKTGEFKAPRKYVYSVSFSPDGERIVSGSNDGTVRVWDVRTQKLVLGPLRGHTTPVVSVAYSPDGERIVSGSDDRSVIVWDARNGKIIKKLTHNDHVTSVAFSPDGNMFVSGLYPPFGNRGAIHIRDVRTSENMHSLTCVLTLVFSPNGQYLVLGTEVGVDVWEVESWRRVRSGIGAGTIQAVAVSPDSNRVTYSQINNIAIADMRTGKVVMELLGHKNKVTCLAFSPDGTWIASGSSDYTIRIWDTATGNSILTLEIWAHVRSIAVSPDGTKIVAGCLHDDINIYLYSRESIFVNKSPFQHQAKSQAQTQPTEPFPLPNPLQQVPAPAAKPPPSEHTPLVLPVTSDPVIHTPAQSSPCLLPVSSQHAHAPAPPSEHTLPLLPVMSGPALHTAALVVEPSPHPLPVSTQHAPHTFHTTGEFKGHTNNVFSLSFSSDGEQIISGSRDNSVRVWDVKTQKVILGPLHGHTNDVDSVAYSPDGERIVSGSGDCSVIVWDARNGKIIKKLTHINRVTSVAFSPDGSTIASSSLREDIHIWDSRTVQNTHSLTCNNLNVNALVFSPNGQYLVSSTEVGVDVWEVESWQRVHSGLGAGASYAVAVSPDSNHVACGQKNNIIIADMKTGKVVMELQGHAFYVSCLAFSLDGTWIASGSVDQTIRFRDTATGNSILTLETESGVYSIAISPDGTKIVAGCWDVIYLFSSESIV